DVEPAIADLLVAVALRPGLAPRWPAVRVQVVGDEVGAGGPGQVGGRAPSQPLDDLGGLGDGLGPSPGAGVPASSGLLPADPPVAVGLARRVGAYASVELENLSVDGHVWRRVARRGHMPERWGNWGKTDRPPWGNGR